MAAISQQDIRLISIEPIKVGGADLGQKKLTLGVFGGDETIFVPSERRLAAAEFVYDRELWKDSDLVRIAQADFHELCKALVIATEAWAMTAVDRKDCEHPNKVQPLDIDF